MGILMKVFAVANYWKVTELHFILFFSKVAV